MCLMRMGDGDGNSFCVVLLHPVRVLGLRITGGVPTSSSSLPSSTIVVATSASTFTVSSA